MSRNLHRQGTISHDSPPAGVNAREVISTGGDRGPIPVEGGEAPSAARSNVGIPVGESLTSLMQRGGGRRSLEELEGYGPKIVILHDGVRGPGRAGIYRRGQVVSLSKIMGEAIMKDRDRLAQEIARYTDQKNLGTPAHNPALREAIGEEANFTQIRFVEGEQALSSTLLEAQQRVALLEAENKKLRGAASKVGGAAAVAQLGDMGPSAAQVQQQGPPREQAEREKTQDVSDPTTPPADGTTTGASKTTGEF